MADEILIRNRGEAIDYLMSEGFSDATIRRVALYGLETWLVSSDFFPPSIDDGHHHWLLPNGRIVTTHVLGPSITKEYENQFGEPFPRSERGQTDG